MGRLAVDGFRVAVKGKTKWGGTDIADAAIDTVEDGVFSGFKFTIGNFVLSALGMEFTIANNFESIFWHG